MKIFLTGHKGFIGWWLGHKLLEAGYEVETDLRQFDKHNYHRVIHLAAKTTISNDFDPDLFDSNILFAKKIMRTPCPLIYASSCSAQHMTNPYAFTKRYAEYLGAIHGNAIGLRFHNVYGPNNNKGVVNFLLQQKDGSRITVRGPELIRDYIYVEDVINWIMRYVELGFPPGVVEVGTGVGTCTSDLVEMFSAITKRKFILDFGKHGDHEPGRMVASNKSFLPQNLTSLEEGLRKTIAAYE